VCTYHGARSRIAEEFSKQIAPGRIEAYSSCFDPWKIGSLPIDIMREAGISLSAESPKPISKRHNEGEIFDYVICLCHIVSTEQCPLFKAAIDRLYAKMAKTVSWSIPDFRSLSGTEEEKRRVPGKLEIK